MILPGFRSPFFGSVICFHKSCNLVGYAAVPAVWIIWTIGVRDPAQMQLQEFLLEKIKKNSIQPQAGKESLSIKAPAASNGGFDPRGSRQISIQAWILGSLLAGIKIVRVAGLEPARYRYRGILSPLCLPIPPYPQTIHRRKYQFTSMNNGWRWIRTTEAICSRFTVCPLWPLGNPSIYSRRRRHSVSDNIHLTIPL